MNLASELRAALPRDAAAILVLSLYGTLVCPFLAGIGFASVAGTFVVGFGVSWIFTAIFGRLAASSEGAFSRPYWRHAMRYWCVATGVAAFQAAALGFPMGSTLKVVLGTLAFGHFVAADLSMRAALRRRGESASLEALLWFGAGGVAFSGLILALVVQRDLGWLASAETFAERQSIVSMIRAELAFIAAVLVVLFARLGWSARRALLRSVEEHQALLGRLVDGQLRELAPAPPLRELGALTQSANDAIVALRAERQRWRLFGPSLSERAFQRLGAQPGAKVEGFLFEATWVACAARVQGDASEPSAQLEAINGALEQAMRQVQEGDGFVAHAAGGVLLAAFSVEAEANERALAVARVLAELSVESEDETPGSVVFGVGVHRGAALSGMLGAREPRSLSVAGESATLALSLAAQAGYARGRILLTDAAHASLDAIEQRRWQASGVPDAGPFALFELVPGLKAGGHRTVEL